MIFAALFLAVQAQGPFPYLVCSAEERTDPAADRVRYRELADEASRLARRRRWGRAYVALKELGLENQGYETGRGAELLGQAEMACREGRLRLGRQHFHDIDCASSYVGSLLGSLADYQDLEGGEHLTERCLEMSYCYPTRLGTKGTDRREEMFDHVAAVCETARRSFPTDAQRHGICKTLPDVEYCE